MQNVVSNQITIEKKRLYFLDNLKIFLTILVIVHHVGQAYGPTGGFWEYKSSLHENINALGYFFAVNAGFFMGLFFMISGYFVPGSYDNKGRKWFVKDKLIRLGIPALFVFFTIQPVEMYFYNINYVADKPSGFLNYYFTRYLGFGKDMSFGHLWFAENLLFFMLLYVLFRTIVPKIRIKRDQKISILSFILITGLVIALISLVVRIWYPIDKWIGIFFIIQSEVAHLPQYVILFVVGIISYRKNLFLKLNNKTGYFCIIIAVAMVMIVHLHFLVPSGIINFIFDKWAIYESFMAVFICWGLLFFFRQYLNRTSKFVSKIAETSFAAYIFHFPVVLAVQFSLDKVNIYGAVGKFFTVSIISIVVTFLISYIIRKIPYVNRVI
jgi:peptidoglycan/LPS O-acetylase OafA/YrhL